MNAGNAGVTVPVLVGGTLVPLPAYQSLNGFTADAANSTFTVPTTGTYMVTYRIQVTAALGVSSRVLRNGVALTGSTFAPTVSTGTFSATTFATLNAGDTLELQMFGVAAAAVLQGGNGATLTVVRLA